MFGVVGEFSACTGQKLTVPNLCRGNTLVLVFQTGITKAIGKGEWADKQRLSGMDAASQPSGMISRRLCVQPNLPDRSTASQATCPFFGFSLISRQSTPPQATCACEFSPNSLPLSSQPFHRRILLTIPHYRQQTLQRDKGEQQNTDGDFGPPGTQRAVKIDPGLDQPLNQYAE